MRSFIEYCSFFTEAVSAVSLGTGQLQKPNGVTGESRVDILRRMIKKKKPLELVKGGMVVVTDINGAMKALDDFEDNPTNFQLTTNKGIIVLSKLRKSEVFGGGGAGAGGGTEQTKNVESAQCLWCAAMLEVGPSTAFEEFTNKVLKSASKNVSVDASMDEMLGISDAWKRSAYLSAQLLIREGYIKKGMTFHRGDKLMKEIYSTKDLAYKLQGLSSLKDDKWNPGDIWATTPAFKIKDLQTDSIRALLKSILDQFIKRALVGISLKQVQKKAQSHEYNIVLPPDTDDYRVLNFGAKSMKTGRGDFWSTKGGEVYYDDGQLTIKDNSAFGSIKAEIKAKTARGGGAGWGYIADTAKQVFNINLPSPPGSVVAGKIAKGDRREIKKMYDVVSEVEQISLVDFTAQIMQKDAPWIHAKYGVCLFLYPIAKFGGQKANRFITKIVNYAGSKSEDSSAYVKIYS